MKQQEARDEPTATRSGAALGHHSEWVVETGVPETDSWPAEGPLLVKPDPLPHFTLTILSRSKSPLVRCAFLAG